MPTSTGSIPLARLSTWASASWSRTERWALWNGETWPNRFSATGPLGDPPHPELTGPSIGGSRAKRVGRGATHRGALVGQQTGRHRPTVILLTEDIVDRGWHIIEEFLTKLAG